jgi:phospholipase/carboxylesterase
VILLHGYGSNEQDLFDLATYFGSDLLTLSLRAPLVLEPGAFAWFEIGFTRDGIVADNDQAERSRMLLIECIEQAIQVYAADPAQVVLIGFSQGATMAALVGLTRPDLVCATAILSGIVPTDILSVAPEPATLQGHSFFVAHGTQDVVVGIEHGRATNEFLASLPILLTYQEYTYGHTIGQEELHDLVAWLRGVLRTA